MTTPTIPRVDVLRGQENGNAILTDKQVIDIRNAWKAGAVQRALAYQYGVHFTQIYHIVHYKQWKHLP